MLKLSLIATLVVACVAALVPAANASLSVDQAFGKSGVIAPELFPKAAYEEVARGVTIQADGKLVVPLAMRFRYGHLDRRPLIRYSVDGSRDYSYGHKGAAWIRAGHAPYVTIRGVKTAADESTIVWGEYGYNFKKTSDYQGTFIARVSRDGAVDKDFGKDGAARIAFGRNEGHLIDVTPEPDGSIYVTHQVYLPRPDRVEVTIDRLAPNGRLDKSFATNGRKRFSVPKDSSVGDVAVAGSSAFVLLTGGEKNRCVVRKYVLAGSVPLDPSFGQNGGAAAGVVPALPGSVYCDKLTVTAVGGLLVTGARFDQGEALAAVSPPKLPPEVNIPPSSPDEPSEYIQRLTPAGNPDLTFGTGGAIVINSNYMDALTLELPGGGVLSGSGCPPEITCLSAYEATGTPMTSFGTAGIKKLNGEVEASYLTARGGTVVALYLGYSRSDTQYSRILRLNATP